MSKHAYRSDLRDAVAGVVTISGGFQVNGASDPATFNSYDGQASTNKPNGITSITHTGTGEYTITLEDQFYSVVGVALSLELATAADKFVQVTSISNINSATTACTIKVTTISGASAADIAASGNDGVWFTLRVKTSSVV